MNQIIPSKTIKENGKRVPVLLKTTRLGALELSSRVNDIKRIPGLLKATRVEAIKLSSRVDKYRSGWVGQDLTHPLRAKSVAIFFSILTNVAIFKS